MKKPRWLTNNLALITGLVMGILAAVAQGYWGIQPPNAEGVCFVSHPSNLINWISNTLFATEFTVHDVFVAVPVLTPVGAILGSWIAAATHKEFKLRRGPVRDNFWAFILGFLVINFGLLWGSCPIRTGLLASYGMVFAWLVLVAIVLGVIASCEYIKWRTKREW